MRIYTRHSAPTCILLNIQDNPVEDAGGRAIQEALFSYCQASARRDSMLTAHAHEDKCSALPGKDGADEETHGGVIGDLSSLTIGTLTSPSVVAKRACTEAWPLIDIQRCDVLDETLRKEISVCAHTAKLRLLL
jgi:hypothetical protein